MTTKEHHESLVHNYNTRSKTSRHRPQQEQQHHDYPHHHDASLNKYSQKHTLDSRESITRKRIRSIEHEDRMTTDEEGQFILYKNSYINECNSILMT